MTAEEVAAAGIELRRSMERLGDEHPHTVYTREGYSIWLTAVAARMLAAAASTEGTNG